MNRKVIKQGNNTLTLTLPKTWTNQFGIRAGDNINVEQKGNELVLSTGKSLKLSEVEVDVSEMDGSSIILLIRGLYRKGYDRVIIHTSDMQVKHYRAGVMRRVDDVITTEVNRLMGFELFDQGKGKFEIRSISTDPIEDFDTTLRRIFLQTLQYYDDFASSLQKKDFNALTTLIEKPDSLTKFISYASRLLNKKGYPKHDYTSFLYHLIESLELINDCIKNAVRFADKKHVVCSSRALRLTREMEEILKMYYDIYYHFKQNAVTQYSQHRNRIIEMIDTQFNIMQKGEMAIILQLRPILDIVRESLRLRASLL